MIPWTPPRDEVGGGNSRTQRSAHHGRKAETTPAGRARSAEDLVPAGVQGASPLVAGSPEGLAIEALWCGSGVHSPGPHIAGYCAEPYQDTGAEH